MDVLWDCYEVNSSKSQTRQKQGKGTRVESWQEASIPVASQLKSERWQKAREDLVVCQQSRRLAQNKKAAGSPTQS